MEEADQMSLTKNLDFLVNNTNNIEDLLLFLTQKGVLLKVEKESMTKIPQNDKKLTELYSLLVKKGPTTYKYLLEALKMSGNWKVVDKLQSTCGSKQIKIVDDDEGDSSAPAGVRASRLLFEQSVRKTKSTSAITSEAEEKESKVRNILTMFQSTSFSNDLDPPPESSKEKLRPRVQKAFPTPIPATSAPSDPVSPIIQEFLDSIKNTENWLDQKMNSVVEYSNIRETESELSNRIDDLLYTGNDLVSKSDINSKQLNNYMESVNRKSGLLWPKLRLLRIELGSKQEKFEYFGKDVSDDKEMEQFPGIDRNIEKSLKTLHLRNVVIDGSKFVDSIRNCVNLEEIRLEKVEIKGIFNSRATFPRLALFYIEQTRFSAGNVYDYIQKIDPLEAYLFFNKDEEQPNWSIDQIWTLGVDIKISVNGSMVLYVDHEKREFTSMLKRSDSILKNSAGHVTRVAVNQIRISHTDLPTQLTELNLYQCDGLYLSTYLSQCLNLTEISIWGGIEKKTLHLSTLPNTLKRAAFGYVDIVNSRSSNLELNELYSYRCKWLSGEADASDEPIETITAKCKRVGIVGGNSGSKPNPNLLKNILESGTEWIFLFDFDWRDSFETKIKMKEFVQSTGLEGNETGFIVKKVRSGEKEKWSGNEVTKAGRNRLEYGHFKWEEFWNTYETSPGGLD